MVLGWVLLPVALIAQARLEVPPPTGEIHVTYTEPSEEGQAVRLREMTAELLSMVDPLERIDRVDIVIVHSALELEQRLGRANALSGVSYVHGILFLSPLNWQVNPTAEAIQHELREALIRLTTLQLAGGHRLPSWLEEGLVAVLGKRSYDPVTAESVFLRAPLLLDQWEPDAGDRGATGYWAVRYLVEERGGFGSIRQLLRLVAQRPDSFRENLSLVYGTSVGELERAWRSWLARLVAEARRKREGGVREGPLVRP